MCGIVGVRSERGVRLSRVVSVLQGLQHRGQEASGFVGITTDGREVGFKDVGLVSEVFRRYGADPLLKVAVAHTRYSTQGESYRPENVQPFVGFIGERLLALVHNGNLTNYPQLKAELQRDGVILRSTSDSEVILLLYARESGAPEERIRRLTSKVEGAWTVLMIDGDRLLAFRDPYGFRPLWMGREGDEVWFASEDSALRSAEIDVVEEVGIGEGYVVDGRVRKFGVGVKVPLPCSFELVYFARPDSNLFGRSVYEWRLRAGEVLAEVDSLEADVVVPVPDSGTIYAIGYARRSGIPFQMGLIRSHYVGRSFIQPSQDVRRRTVRAKLFPVPFVLKGRRVVLIDDSLVRGTTMREIVRMVRDAGAKEVHVRIGSPPVISPCYFGIDTPTREELAASRMDTARIGEFIEADSILYLPLSRFREALPNFCVSCFTGEYAVKVPSDVRV
ncbi:MAG: amidophosphoribosyltransferase [Thermotogae bacterium]|nr:amidophosphoribosyltransferase [Thermotogota bacterium]